jgi:hypothetical protein
LITIERLSAVIFPTKTTIKKPKTAFLLSLTTILVICGMHVHEILHYIIISADPQRINSTGILCVTNFNKQFWSIYNQVNVLIHHLVPFIIQIIGITLLIVSAAKSRAKTNKNDTTGFSEILKRQFKLQKELYITPAVIIFAALPQLIFTTSFACKELNSAWQRYILLITYLFSFTPQICGFIIFVLPSTTYKSEFRHTKIGQHFFRLIGSMRKNNVRARK